MKRRERKSDRPFELHWWNLRESSRFLRRAFGRLIIILLLLRRMRRGGEREICFEVNSVRECCSNPLSRRPAGLLRHSGRKVDNLLGVICVYSTDALKPRRHDLRCKIREVKTHTKAITRK